MSLLLSIVIPTFNRAGPIHDALQSLCEQTTPSEEIIVVDDGSSDETERVVAQFSGVRYVRITHQGTTRARNVGLNLAQGRFLFPFDSDWLLRAGALAYIRSLIDQGKGNFLLFPCVSHPGGVVSTQVSEERPVTAMDFLEERVQELVTVVSLDLIKKSGLCYPEEYRNVGENMLWIAVAKIEQGRLFPWTTVTYRTDITNRTCSGTQQVKNALDMARLSEQWARQLAECGCPLGLLDKKRLAAGVYRVLANQPDLGRTHFQNCPGLKALTLRWLSHCPPVFRLLFLIYRQVQTNWYDRRKSKNQTI